MRSAIGRPFGQLAQQFINKELQYGARHFAPVPVVLQRGSGAYLWDVEGKKYLDFIAGFSAVNQGHCHPKILETLVTQASTFTMTARAFFNDQLGAAEEKVCKVFGYENALFMNTGVEAAESALKVARRWGYEVKGIPSNQARVVFVQNNFWGRSIAACGSSNNLDRYHNFGPYPPNLDLIPYNDVNALEQALQDPTVAAFMVEPIQGEAGVILPSDGYLKQVRDLCTKYNILWIADEVQTGIGRCGKMLAVEWENVRPDILVLGKSLSGGMLPISVALADQAIMKVLVPGSHGSTFGGNPLAAAVCQTALDVVVEEGLVENSLTVGTYLQTGLKSLVGPKVKEARGRGLMCAIELHEGFSAPELCLALAEQGLLTKSAKQSIIRITPPLVITEEQVDWALGVIAKALDQM